MVKNSIRASTVNSFCFEFIAPHLVRFVVLNAVIAVWFRAGEYEQQQHYNTDCAEDEEFVWVLQQSQNHPATDVKSYHALQNASR